MTVITTKVKGRLFETVQVNINKVVIKILHTNRAVYPPTANLL